MYSIMNCKCVLHLSVCVWNGSHHVVLGRWKLSGGLLLLPIDSLPLTQTPSYPWSFSPCLHLHSHKVILNPNFISWIPKGHLQKSNSSKGDSSHVTGITDPGHKQATNQTYDSWYMTTELQGGSLRWIFPWYDNQQWTSVVSMLSWPLQ